jgi:hypothetical protein
MKLPSNVIIIKYDWKKFVRENVSMRAHVQVVMILLALSLVPYGAVYGENSIEYSIQIDGDGSAEWVIQQTRDINSSIVPDQLDDLQSRITPLLEASRNQTQRIMTVEIVSFKSTLIGSYFLDEYRFHWGNFSEVEDASIIVGDVFQVRDFFFQLYGNGEVYITYPKTYIVAEPVVPPPSIRDTSQQLLGWPGTKDFDETGARIVFREKPSTLEFFDILGQNAIPLVSLAAVLIGVTAGFFIFRYSREKKTETGLAHDLLGLPGTESDEEKIVRLLRSSGGTLYQSAITDQCRFSRAKTSQILKAMEKKRIVRRLQKGRGKIVIFNDKSKK